MKPEIEVLLIIFGIAVSNIISGLSFYLAHRAERNANRIEREHNKRECDEMKHDIRIIINYGELWTQDEIRAIKLKWQKRIASEMSYRRNLIDGMAEMTGRRQQPTKVNKG